VGENKLFAEQYLRDLEIDSTLKAHWLNVSVRAAPAFPAFFTKTGYGTMMGEGKEVHDSMAKNTLWSVGIVCRPLDRACLEGDTEGNLIYRKTARNFNPMMATAGR